MRLTEDGSTATVSMTMEEYKGFIVEFKDLKVKFTDDKSETQILSFVTNGGWDYKNISQFQSATDISVNYGSFPINVSTPLSLVLTTNNHTKKQHINFQASILYFRDDVNYTQISK